jgi:Zn-dependent protease
LAIFNLLPVHPLDGGKILARFLPPDLERKMEDNQQMIGIILMVLLFTGIIGQVLRPAIYAVAGVMYFVANTIVGIAI